MCDCLNRALRARNCGIGMLTPPVGMNQFVLAAVTRRDVPLAAIARAAVPYWIALLVAVALMMAFPIIALFLPQRFS